MPNEIFGIEKRGRSYRINQFSFDNSVAAPRVVSPPFLHTTSNRSSDVVLHEIHFFGGTLIRHQAHHRKAF